MCGTPLLVLRVPRWSGIFRGRRGFHQINDYTTELCHDDIALIYHSFSCCFIRKHRDLLHSATLGDSERACAHGEASRFRIRASQLTLLRLILSRICSRYKPTHSIYSVPVFTSKHLSWQPSLCFPGSLPLPWCILLVLWLWN